MLPSADAEQVERREPEQVRVRLHVEQRGDERGDAATPIAVSAVAGEQVERERRLHPGA